MAFTIKTSEYIKSAPTIKDAPEWQLPEIAFLGRSNVGKSSLINKLTGRKKLAHTSNTPGKTRLMNFYKLNNAFAFVDFPGYGYAKVSKAEQAQWQTHFEDFLMARDNLILVVQLVDGRHPPQESDKEMLLWLSHNDFPVIHVMNKVDKLGKSKVQYSLRRMAHDLHVDADLLFPFSAETGDGKKELLNFLGEYIDSLDSIDLTAE